MAFVTPETTIQSLHLKSGDRVADFGAGTGMYTLAAARILAGSGHVYAIDLNKDLLQHVVAEANHAGLGGVESIWADVEVPHSTKQHDMTIDAVIFSNLLFQLDDIKAALQEARRILKPQGKMLIVDWTDSFGGMGPHADAVVTEDKAKTILTDLGFGDFQSVEAGDHHWALVCIKKV